MVKHQDLLIKINEHLKELRQKLSNKNTEKSLFDYVDQLNSHYTISIQNKIDFLQDISYLLENHELTLYFLHKTAQKYPYLFSNFSSTLLLGDIFESNHIENIFLEVQHYLGEESSKNSLIANEMIAAEIQWCQTNKISSNYSQLLANLDDYYKIPINDNTQIKKENVPEIIDIYLSFHKKTINSIFSENGYELIKNYIHKEYADKEKPFPHNLTLIIAHYLFENHKDDWKKYRLEDQYNTTMNLCKYIQYCIKHNKNIPAEFDDLVKDLLFSKYKTYLKKWSKESDKTIKEGLNYYLQHTDQIPAYKNLTEYIEMLIQVPPTVSYDDIKNDGGFLGKAKFNEALQYFSDNPNNFTYKRNPDQNRNYTACIVRDTENPYVLEFVKPRRSTSHVFKSINSSFRYALKTYLTNDLKNRDYSRFHEYIGRKRFYSTKTSEIPNEANTLGEIYPCVHYLYRKDKNKHEMHLPIVPGKDLSFCDTSGIADHEWFSIAGNSLVQLKEVHKQKKVHADIKPENIMIWRNEWGLLCSENIDLGASQSQNAVKHNAPHTRKFIPESERQYTDHFRFYLSRDLYQLGLTLQYKYGWFPKKDFEDLTNKLMSFYELDRKSPNGKTDISKEEELSRECQALYTKHHPVYSPQNPPPPSITPWWENTP